MKWEAIFQWVWKSEVEVKIKVFMWKVIHHGQPMGRKIGKFVAESFVGSVARKNQFNMLYGMGVIREECGNHKSLRGTYGL